MNIPYFPSPDGGGPGRGGQMRSLCKRTSYPLTLTLSRLEREYGAPPLQYLKYCFSIFINKPHLHFQFIRDRFANQLDKVFCIHKCPFVGIEKKVCMLIGDLNISNFFS